MESVIEEIYRSQSRRVLATLIRLLGDFDRAEEALHDAFAAAARTWPVDGIPDNPSGWLVSTGRFKAIDAIRRRARFDAAQQHIEDSLYSVDATEMGEMEAIEDDMLRLIFTCCHPAIPADAQTALALREICGLTTEEIAHAFLIPAPTVAQRIVRAKGRIRTANIPYEVPGREALPERLDRVLHVIYLVFNEGYSASSGDAVVRADLTGEAIRLARLLLALLPHPDVCGLLALMLLQDSRRSARSSEEEALVLLADQNRSLWDRAKILEGLALLAKAMRTDEISTYTVQAAIAAEHAKVATAEQTDWPRIAFYYDLLLAAQPSPVVELNRAVAISMAEGPAKGLDLIDAILGRQELQAYHLAHSARADFLRRLGRREEAIAAYQTALSLCRQEPEQAFLRKRISALAAASERQ
ncbi:RNA polymerase sigma factor [Rhizobium lentis]|uniref:RNA polymerase sigma-70 factor (ECF subfamily) n=1 Tax=Rhizobium lentis TaxID=1138194 RepID=A0A7W8XE54_9HYPH|nr:RNA polymerase sigma factor [Rhizobium lentis]MBB4573902.1 RNA polymerase sigma-70 factor (ECF subfamily) [Rhizobium lentis]MBB5549830.1 RNA polymerase sigma-70 factor (ECF subfamily) [Rhizobium lentis]MBB5560162.1 RNA polymerase sigma-70 factor (ECF subfamily) [Rhizobium lentis]MBB5566950.1 RNA polymerase sigma-70 factor (ECF subfamily) [Rhizobium lentis]